MGPGPHPHVFGAPGVGPGRPTSRFSPSDRQAPIQGMASQEPRSECQSDPAGRDLVGVALGEAVELFVPRQAAEPGGGTVLVDGLHHVAGDAAAGAPGRGARGRRRGPARPPRPGARRSATAGWRRAGRVPVRCDDVDGRGRGLQGHAGERGGRGFAGDPASSTGGQLPIRPIAQAEAAAPTSVRGQLATHRRRARGHRGRDRDRGGLACRSTGPPGGRPRWRSCSNRRCSSRRWPSRPASRRSASRGSSSRLRSSSSSGDRAIAGGRARPGRSHCDRACTAGPPLLAAPVDPVPTLAAPRLPFHDERRAATAAGDGNDSTPARIPVLDLDRLRWWLTLGDVDLGRLAIVSVELDNLAFVKERLGYAAGGHLIEAITQRLRTVTRPRDVVAHVNRERFVLVCRDVPDRQAAQALAERIAMGVAHPSVVLAGVAEVTASIGVALAGHSTSVPRACCGAQSRPATRPRRTAARASRSATQPASTTSPTASSAARSPVTSCGSTTSRSSAARPVGSRGSRRSCAGSTPTRAAAARRVPARGGGRRRDRAARHLDGRAQRACRWPRGRGTPARR